MAISFTFNPFTGNFDAINNVTLAAVGAVPNANGATLTGQVLNLQPADATHPGALTAADWNTFNNKQAALTIGNLTDAGTDGITITGGTGAVIGSGTSIAQHVADTTHNGYLSATDWNTFNNKQAAGSYATTSLNNLVTTAINADLKLATDGAFSLGTSASNWLQLQAYQINATNGTKAIELFSTNGRGLVSGTTRNLSWGLSPSTTAPGIKFDQATTNGFVKTSAADGTLTIATSVAAGEMPALSGDISTSAGSTVTAIGANKVTLAMQATLAAHSYIGNNTGSTATPLAVTNTQLTADLNAMVGDSGSGGTKGLVPAPASGDAAAGKFLKASGVWAAPTAAVAIATIQDQKAAGTFGGTFTAGAWQTRTLNTLNDPSSIVTSLASNQFVLPAGTYYIQAFAPARTVSRHRAKLYNVTDSADAILGQTSGAPVGTTVMTSSVVDGIITIAGAKTFEIRHYCSSTEGTDGFGDIAPDGVAIEVYTQVKIIKTG